MMKKIFSVVFLFSLTIFCQTPGADSISLGNPDSSDVSGQDSINVMAMLQTQIDEARERELRGEIKSSFNEPYYKKETKDVKKVSEVENINYSNEESFFTLYKDPSAFKYFLLTAFSIFVISGVFIRRRVNKKSNLFKKELKEKIKSVREENSLPTFNPELKTIRSKLMNTPEQELFEKTITAKARELKIGKGELILAAKIKSYQMAQLSLTKE